MTLIPWKQRRAETAGQLSPATGFRTEMDRLFDSFFSDVPTVWGDRGWPAMAWQPAMDVEETDKQVLVRAELPGVTPDDLDVSIQHGALVISGEKKESEERKESGYLYQERRYGSFRREIALPTAVDEQNVKAEYKDGVLHISLEKSQEALPKKIQVTAK
ncbi:MAG: Hsp20/alpha crystallin family protein [Pirellulales bacterium]